MFCMIIYLTVKGCMDLVCPVTVSVYYTED